MSNTIQLLALFLMGIGLNNRSRPFQMVYLILAFITIIDTLRDIAISLG